MQFQRINKNTAETGFASFTNVDGQTITKGLGGFHCTNTASNTGNNVVGSKTRPAYQDRVGLFAGVASANVADTAVGRFIVWGYAASVFIYGSGSSVTINAGHPLGPVGTLASLGFNSSGSTYAYGPIIALETCLNTVIADTYLKGIVKGM